jgi:hypothetical protein
MDEGQVIEVEFPLDEPPTMPQRAPSGAVIKAPVMRAFQQQSTAEKLCNAALDKLIALVRTIEAEKVPQRLRDSLRPALAANAGRYKMTGG